MEGDLERGDRTRWFTGVTWKGIAFVGLACIANALRRVGPPQDLTWLTALATTVGTGLALMAVALLPVVATINLLSAPPWRRYPAIAVVALLSTLAGIVLVGVIEADGWSSWLDATANDGGIGWLLFIAMVRYGVVVLLFAGVFAFYRLREDREAATRVAEIDRERSVQQMDEARLAVLQAQIEPHFLFNTLANVRRLYQTDATMAGAMLQNLMRYLAVALPQMRADHSTLGREVELARSYLEIQRIRMGRRLNFEIDVPESLHDVYIPPLVLLTLVENGIKHGLNPAAEGGSVRVRAEVDGDQVRIEVSDTGQGFTRSSGGGTGLANTRARLAARFGGHASLRLGPTVPHGITATVTVPHGTARAKDSA